MKRVLALLVLALAGCTSTKLPVDAAPVVSSSGTRVTTPNGTLTGRDWNNQPSESRTSATDGK